MTEKNDDKTRGLNLRNIPGLAAMLAVDRWCVWYWRVRNGQKSKVPRIPGTLANAMSNDLTGARSHDVARAAVLAEESTAGVGWMMLDDLGRAAIDIDRCRDKATGRVDGWALALLTAAGGAYREVTPSGTGLRVIGRLSAAGGSLEAFQAVLRVKPWVAGLEGPDSEEERRWWGVGIRADAAVEIYHACARYITVTGWDGVGDCEADISTVVEWLMERAGKKKVKGHASVAADDGGLSLIGHMEDVTAALEIIPNDDLHWNDWMAMGLATVNASARSEEGYEAFEKWSAKSGRHNQRGANDCREHWEQWKRSPGDRIGIGYLMLEAEKAQPGWVRPSQRPFGGSGGTTRRRIKIIAGELHHLASEGEAAIIASGKPVFQRSMLVRPAVTELDAADGGKTHIMALHRIDTAGMLDLFCQTGEWMRFNRPLKRDVKADPPETVANILLGRVGEWNFPHLRGIIAHPTLRRDGTLLDTPGYDAASGYYLSPPSSLNMPAISAAPTRDECLTAALILEDLLVEFPFVDAASRSVALSLLMTAVLRSAMDVAPIHAATAPRRGTGKSFLYDIAAAIVYGSRCPVIYAGNSSEELEKKLNGLLLAGVSLFSIDNLNVPLEGDLICQVATQSLLDLRRLGKSDMLRTPNSALAGVTGNNMVVVEDVTRRVVMASMDAELERPETRLFEANPFQKVLRDRGKYLAAVLTIVRGYMVANERARVAPLGSFDDYTRFVREPLVWLDRADPAATMEKLHAADPVMAGLRGVMAAWEAAIGLNTPKTASEVIDLARNPAWEFEAAPKGETDDARAAREAKDAAARAGCHALGVALANISKRGGAITPLELGNWLRRHAEGIADGHRFRGEMDPHSKVMLWKLA